MMARYEILFANEAGIIESVEFDNLTKAAEECLTLYQSGKHPTLRYDAVDGFTTAPMCANKWAAKPRLEWWFQFTPVGIYKSMACRNAENSGVRYASHRKGYRGSLKAMRAFAAVWDSHPRP